MRIKGTCCAPVVGFSFFLFVLFCKKNGNFYLHSVDPKGCNISNYCSQAGQLWDWSVQTALLREKMVVGFDGVISAPKIPWIMYWLSDIQFFLERWWLLYVELCLYCSNTVDAFVMWWPYSVLLDFTGWMLQCTHPPTGGRWSVPFGYGVHRCGAGYQTALRHPVGLEDLGRGWGELKLHNYISITDITHCLIQLDKTWQNILTLRTLKDNQSCVQLGNYQKFTIDFLFSFFFVFKCKVQLQWGYTDTLDKLNVQDYLK